MTAARALRAQQKAMPVGLLSPRWPRPARFTVYGRVPPRAKRNRLRRGTKPGDRIPVSGGPLRSTARIGADDEGAGPPRGKCRLVEVEEKIPGRHGLTAGGNRIRTIGPAEKETAVERDPAADHHRLARRPALSVASPVATPSAALRGQTAFGHPNFDTASASASQIIAHKPSDNSRITTSAGPAASGVAAVRADRSRCGSRPMTPRSRRRALRSATSARRRRFQAGFAGARPTFQRCINFAPLTTLATCAQ